MRRVLGGVTVVAVLIAALVVAQWAGPDPAGSAVPAPLATPPAAGDCVLDPEASLLTVNEREFGLRAPSSRIGPCTGDRYGEIALVIADPLVVDVAPGFGEQVQDTATTRCLAASAEYLGMVPDEEGWTQELLYYIGFLGPDDRQRTAGQNWLACVVRPATVSEAPGSPVPAYPASLRDAGETGTARNSTGHCTSPDDLLTPVACGTPHRTEILGTARAGTAIEEVDRDTSCAALVGRVTGLSDPTGGGALTTTVTVLDAAGTVIDDGTAPEGSRLLCAVTSTSPDRLLTGSVRALGGAPLPWQ